MRYSITFLLCIAFNFAIAQDTIKVEKSIHYSSKKHPVQGKEFVSNLKYAREDIIFSDSVKRVEYCYYYDDERECFGESYEIVNDTLIEIKTGGCDTCVEFWQYVRIETNLYQVKRLMGEFVEVGHVETLMPFKRKGGFIMIYSPTKDTLWSKDYDDHYIKISHQYDASYHYPKSIINGPVYLTNQLDKLPQKISGDSLSSISLARTDYCMSYPTSVIRTITFVVDSNGCIRNVEQFEGNFDMKYCPYYVLELIKAIYSNGNLIPGEVNGTPVNVRLFVEVDMQNEYLNRQAQHPAFDKERLPTPR